MGPIGRERERGSKGGLRIVIVPPLRAYTRFGRGYIPLFLRITSLLRGFEFTIPCFETAGDSTTPRREDMRDYRPFQPEQDRPRLEPFECLLHFRSSCSRGNLLTLPQGIELVGELADGGRLDQGRDPLLSLAPERQCCLDRGRARSREMGDVLALVDVPNLDPN